MELKRFCRLMVKSEEAPEDFDFNKYTEETGRELPSDVRSGDLMSLLFVSWLRGETQCYRRSKKSSNL